ncbi:hypothetical protein SSX86_008458 [Deinandra increscens subsp. villosa]|uniref:F-box domain-containing protein n=1 Tax=Deinandra increscens subsp. villosa TaxID=3103831 RepID=A0AAP0DBB0_9ASTR
MDKLHDSLLLQILSRLDDSADVARCRVASKAFNAVFPDLRSIHLVCSEKWFINSTSRVSNSRSTVSNSRPRVPNSQHHIKPLRAVFLDLISKLAVVESVCIDISKRIYFMSHSPGFDSDDFYLMDGRFAKEWLPRVSGSLKSLWLSAVSLYSDLHQSDVLPLISAYCHKLVNLKLDGVWLSVHNMNPMPMLTSLTLAFTPRLEDEHLNELNKCFPNLQVLNLLYNSGLQDPKIHLLNLKTCHFALFDDLQSLTLITPNLITLQIEYYKLTALHVEAPLLSNFYLETLWIESFFTGSLLSIFPVTTIENLTIDSKFFERRYTTDSKLTLGKVFTVFPNMSYLCIKSGAWSELEACLNQQDWEILDGMNGLKTMRAYLKKVDLSLTFSFLAFVLDQCVGLSEVRLLIHSDVIGSVSEHFRSKCMARWPRLNWRWGIWNKQREDSWIT